MMTEGYSPDAWLILILRKRPAPEAELYGYQRKGVPMFLSFLLARINRTARFTWAPALDLADHSVFSTLIPGAQY